MREKREKPGMMLYFTQRELFSALPPDKALTLLLAMFDYAQYGTKPRFTDERLALVWTLLVERLDSDSERYVMACLKHAYSRYAGECKNAGLVCPDFEQWREMTNDGAIPIRDFLTLLPGIETQ